MKNNFFLSKILSKYNNSFNLDSEGEITKHKYSGHFETQIPNLKIQLKIKKYIAALNGGFDSILDSQIIKLHTMIAYCRLCLTECPDWFKDRDYGLDLYDFNILEEIYNKILEKKGQEMKNNFFLFTTIFTLIGWSILVSIVAYIVNALFL